MPDQFGHTALSYDETFTHTLCGRYQREEVYHYLSPFLKCDKPLKILELNCGTGEDALYFANLGHEPTVTDISDEMLDVASHKLRAQSKVKFQKLDISALDMLEDQGPYDLVFSNFGGLNCVSPKVIQSQEQVLHKLLKSSGVFIAVVMGRKCIWERLYFTFKGNLKEALRRDNKASVLAHVDGKDVPTWYYSPKEFKGLLPVFLHLKTKPIGLFIPPSYLDSFFRNKLWFLKLMKLKSKIFRPSFASNYADHYFIALKPSAV